MPRSFNTAGPCRAAYDYMLPPTERLPVMVCPKWVYTRVQLIAIRNVLDYLVAALAVPESAGRVIEIGGADVLTYGEMMTGYAEVRGLRRRLVPVPVLTPRLSSYWVHWVTPIPAEIARPLIEGLRNEAVEPGRLLRLRAEMKLSGDAWIEFAARPRDDGRTLLVQTAYFAPKGLLGLVYWYSLYPIHGPVFSTMIAALAAQPEAGPATPR